MLVNSSLTSQCPSLQYDLSDLLLDFFSRLDNASVAYCVLRNHQGLPDRMGNDIDLLVLPRDARALESCLLTAGEEAGWQILKIPRRYGYRSYWFRSPDGHFMHFDAWSRLFWKGLRWADEELILHRRVRCKQFYVLNPADEAASLLLKDLLPKAVIKEKYRNQIVDVAKQRPEEFCRFLECAVGKSLAVKLLDYVVAGNWDTVLRQRSRIIGHLFLTRILCNPFEPFIGMGRFLFSYLSVILTAHNGVFVALIGPDGSGKSTVANELTRYLLKLLPQPRYCHGRFGFLPDLRVLLNIARRLCGLGRLPTVPSGIHAVHDVPPHGTLRCVVHALYYSLDFVLGYFTLMRINAIGDLMVFDRYFYDWFIQSYYSRVPRLFLPVLKFILPRPDLVVFLSNTPEEIHRRKPELTIEQIEEQNQKCRRIIRNMPYAIVVSTKQSPEEVVCEIGDRVVEIMARHCQEQQR